MRMVNTPQDSSDFDEDAVMANTNESIYPAVLPEQLQTYGRIDGMSGVYVDTVTAQSHVTHGHIDNLDLLPETDVLDVDQMTGVVTIDPSEWNGVPEEEGWDINGTEWDDIIEEWDGRVTEWTGFQEPDADDHDKDEL
jgi:hypothetical protein